MEMEKPTSIGKRQSTDESSGSPVTLSPENFGEDNPPDPSELKKIGILEKATNKLLHFLKPTGRLISCVKKCELLTFVLILNCFNFYVYFVLLLFLRA